MVSKGETPWNIVESELSAQGIDVNSYNTQKILKQITVEGSTGPYVHEGDIVVIPMILDK